MTAKRLYGIVKNYPADAVMPNVEDVIIEDNAVIVKENEGCKVLDAFSLVYLTTNISDSTDIRVYLNSVAPENEIVASGINERDNKFSLISKSKTHVPEDLEDRFWYASQPENDIDELDFVMDLFDIGYVLDDFKYDNDRYLWIKEFAERHGLI